MGQSRIESILLEEVLKFGHVEVRRHTTPTSLFVEKNFVHDHCPTSYPIRVELENLATSETSQAVNGSTPTKSTETRIEARYLLGCDGAHSWVRSQLGLRLEGASRDVSWGVLDLLPITDFRKHLLALKSRSGFVIFC